mgnify:CR=1 FL=1
MTDINGYECETPKPEPLHDIGWAVAKMMSGNKIYRRGWNGKGIYCAVQCPAKDSDCSQVYAYVDTTGLRTKNPDALKSRVPWAPSQTDLFAVDWEAYSGDPSDPDSRSEIEKSRSKLKEADIKTYYRKASRISAACWNHTIYSYYEIKSWIGDEGVLSDVIADKEIKKDERLTIFVKDGSKLYLDVGDYLVKDADGKLSVLRPEEFKKLYGEGDPGEAE